MARKQVVLNVCVKWPFNRKVKLHFLFSSSVSGSGSSHRLECLLLVDRLFVLLTNCFLSLHLPLSQSTELLSFMEALLLEEAERESVEVH